MAQTSQNAKILRAAVETVYEAFTDPRALEVWLAPGEMTGKVHDFEFKVGGGYRMSLFYPESEKEMKGKTTEREDRFTARFVEIIPNKKIIPAVNFESPDPDFSGEMIMETTFDPNERGTKVTFSFQNIPKGIKPEDNEAGTIATLEKLARYAEGTKL